MKFSKHLYVYPWQDPQANNCNSYLISGKTVMLIDPGHAAYASGLIEEIQQDGVNPAEIGLVLNTHCHPDHCEANPKFAGKETLFAMHEEEYKFLNDSGRTLFVQMGMEPPSSPVQILLREGVLKLGKDVFEVMHTPGHSPGGISIYWPSLRALFSGDTLFAMGLGRVDLPGGDAQALINSFQRLMTLDIEYLFPGHGQMLRGRSQIRQILQYMGQQIESYL